MNLLIHASVPNYRSVSIFFSAEFNYHSNKEIWSVSKFTVPCHDCSSVGSPAVALVKEKLSAEGFEGCEV